MERIAICSIQLQIAERQFIGVMEAGSTRPKGKFYEDLQDRAQRRYLAAIKALAQVRRLQLPLVAQLNVATNQVNVANPAPTEGTPEPPPKVLPDGGVLTVDNVLGGRSVERVVQECWGKGDPGRES